MIIQKYSRVVHTETRPAALALVLEGEGMAMVFVKENGVTVCTTSTGGSGEIFAGLSLARNTPALFLTHIEEGTITDGTFELPRLPIAGQINVTVNGTNRKVVANTPADGTEIQLVGELLTAHADDADKAIEVLFKYEPTVTEAAQFTGHVAVGGLAQHAVNNVGLITKGDVATNYFDAGVDWADVIGDVYLGSDGMLTTETTGEKADGVTVISAPSASNPTLLVKVNV
jgi:hypothetical protein